MELSIEKIIECHRHPFETPEFLVGSNVVARIYCTIRMQLILYKLELSVMRPFPVSPIDFIGIDEGDRVMYRVVNTKTGDITLRWT